jgi:hypothetical protein
VLTSKLEAAQARIRERLYPHFSWIVNSEIPWAGQTKQLADLSFALVSTAV